MAENGRAIVLTGVRQHEIREYPVPDPEPGAVLVKVTMAGICGSDLHVWRGEMAVAGRPKADRVGGHESTGVVAKLGAGVTTDSLGRPLKEGDRVCYTYTFPCRRCYQCDRGQTRACNSRFRRASAGDPPYFHGCFGDYYYLHPGHSIYKTPDELTDDAVAPLNCALCQAIAGLNEAGVGFGDRVVVQGAGGLGLYAVAVAREMGADRVISIDGVQARLELARRCGADEVVNLTEVTSVEDRVALVNDLTEGVGADVVCDFVGYPEAIGEGLQMLRPGGTYLEVGNISPGVTVSIDPSKLVFGNQRIVGIEAYEPNAIPAALNFLSRTRDKYPLDQIASHHFPLDQFGEAMEQAEWLGRQKGLGVTRALLVP